MPSKWSNAGAAAAPAAASLPPFSAEPSPGHFTDRYDVGRKLGKGSYASVYECADRRSGAVYAVKVVDKSKAGPKDVEDANHEIAMMAKVGHHPNVVRMVEFFSTAAHLYIVMDLLDGGMLFDRIVKLKHYSEKSAVEVVRHMLEALAQIHAAGVMHRDLKPENLLLPHSPDEMAEVTDVCIADFGLAAVGTSTVCCGSPCYIAPEVILRGYYKRISQPYDEKCDIWSVGIITYALLSGRLPFFGDNIEHIFSLVIAGKWSFVGSSWKDVSDPGRAFIEACLAPDPQVRPSAAELLRHPWVRLPDSSSNIHLTDTLAGMRELCARRTRAAAKVFALAKVWLSVEPNDRPPFMKYIHCTDPLLTRLTHQSQTDPSVLHELDYALPLLSRISDKQQQKNSSNINSNSSANKKERIPTKSKSFKMQDCCSCGSESVCRHIQNLHEYLFVGKRSMDVIPFMDVLVTTCDELLGEAIHSPHSVEVLEKLVKVAFCMQAACVFSRSLSEVPQDALKPNFMVSPAKLSTKNERIGRWAAVKRVEWEAKLVEAKQDGGSGGRHADPQQQGKKAGGTHDRSKKSNPEAEQASTAQYYGGGGGYVPVGGRRSELSRGGGGGASSESSSSSSGITSPTDDKNKNKNKNHKNGKGAEKIEKRGSCFVA